MIKFWKSQQNALRKFLKLKRTIHILNMNEKLADSNTATESYWTILNHLLFNKKLVTIPPLLVDGTFTSDFSEKAYIFNNFFASICTHTYR